MGRQSRDVSIDVDTIIAELGHGRFHVLSFMFIAVAIFFNTITSASFIFTARDTQYRCFIEECDMKDEHITYEPSWLIDVVPYSDGVPSKCEHKIKLNITHDTDRCDSRDYVNDSLASCDKWVYGDGETIVREFDIACQEWKGALVGTINSIGQFVCLSFSGLISDTVGRKNVMVWATVFSGIIGVAQSFTNNYWSFLFFELLVTTVGSGAYSAAFILGLEIMVPGKRVLGSTIMNLVCGVATVCLGVAAWLVPNWRHLLRVIYFPSLVMILSIWIIPESIRWLIVKGRRPEASKIIRRAAKLNRVSLSEELSKYLEHLSSDQNSPVTAHNDGKKKFPLKEVLKSRRLIVRLLICAFCWMTNAFVYYGLSLNAVLIMSNKNNPFLNFILVSLVELPAQGVVVFMLDSVGRRLCLCTSLLGSAFSCLAFILIPSEQYEVSLTVYLLGKLFITVSFNVVYIYTVELFPTTLRHSILSCCSMLGRIGGMLAPLTPLLSVYYGGLPMILFASSAIVSGFSVLIFPETLNIKLPDTIYEAETIGKVKLLAKIEEEEANRTVENKH